MSSRFVVGFGAWLLGAVTATSGSMIAVNVMAHGLLDAQAQQLGGTAVSADVEPGSSTGPSPAAMASPSTRVKPTAAKPTHSANGSSNAASSGSNQGPSGGSASQPPSGGSSSQPPSGGSSSPSSGKLLFSSGGSVMATCESAGAYLLYWSPNQGYEVGGVVRGPAAVASVAFETSTSEIVMQVSCSGGTPVAHVQQDSGR